jgi:hypothetical protein
LSILKRGKRKKVSTDERGESKHDHSRRYGASERERNAQEEGSPETRNETGDDDDHVSDGKVVSGMVTDGGLGTGGDRAVADGGEDDGRVQSESFESEKKEISTRSREEEGKNAP